jgi:Cu+-exporting ATPase
MPVTKKLKVESSVCFHCGNECSSSQNFLFDDKTFCCEGCKTVYQILNANSLCQYYEIDKNAGIRTDLKGNDEFSYLDNPDIVAKILNFSDGERAKVTFFIPSIHCSSCLWLLENLYQINEGIIYSEVDFLKKQVAITFKEKAISLRELVQLLTSIGYEPLIQLNDTHNQVSKSKQNNIIKRIAVAGFCAGNIMMFSFPEYFGLDSFSQSLGHFFVYANLILSLPVLLYSGSPYFESVYNSLKNRYLNIDFPVLLGIMVTWLRSVYEVLSQSGSGYFDSMSGLIFFLLIGKWFQQKTFEYLSFERDYKSYFPLAVTIIKNGEEISESAEKLKVGDKILIKNNELIPADAMLYKGEANIDYSFVTGESEAIQKNLGALIYAGGRQKGNPIALEVVKETSKSYLTQLWNNPAFEKSEKEKGYKYFTDEVGKYFTIAILGAAFCVGVYWYLYDASKILNAFTAMLIIACPCTLSLSYPIALGNILQKLGVNKLYLKNIQTIEKLSKIDTIVFDKTGTITNAEKTDLKYEGVERNMFENIAIASLVRCSNHPLSRIIQQFLEINETHEVIGFKEKIGEGIEGKVLGMEIRLGKKRFVCPIEKDIVSEGNTVHLSINHVYKGYFKLSETYKPFLAELIQNLSVNHGIHVLSGDNDSEKNELEKIMTQNYSHQNPENAGWKLTFNKSPIEKLEYIQNLQQQGKKILMLGDGLNDAGALKKANVGIAITENITNFTPASDGILESEALKKLPQFLTQSKKSMNAIRCSFAVSLIYNLVGLCFAVRGDLQPIIAAILMPLSSITVVLVGLLGSGGFTSRN